MISRSARYLGILVGMFALSACETTGQSGQMDQSGQIAEPEQASAQMTTDDDPSANTPLKLRLKGMKPDTAIADANALRMTLSDYKVQEPGNGNFKSWIKDIKEARGGFGSEVLGGIGGIPGRTLLWLAERSIRGNGQFAFAPGASVTGQIQAECEGQPGYLVNEDGSGRLCVTVFTTKALGASGNTRIRAERFLVLVDPDGFHVETKKPLTPTPHGDSVFPQFTQASKMPISESTADGFDHKLWASGTSIHVVKLWRDNNYDPQDPDFEKVDLNDKENLSLKAPNAEACIDMMFMGEPPTHYDQLQGPPHYCLGRCDDPPLINTK